MKSHLLCRKGILLIILLLACSFLSYGCSKYFDPIVALRIFPDFTSPTTININTIQSFEANAYRLNDSDLDLFHGMEVTDQCVWSSSNTGVAKIDSRGIARGIGPGTTTITATYTIPNSKATVSDFATLTVRASHLASISVNPSSATMFPGDQINLAAIGKYTDGSTKVFTNNAAWVSSNPGVASVGNGAPPPGQVTAVTVGSATITATVTGVSGTSQITVVAPVTLPGQAKQVSSISKDAVPRGMSIPMSGGPAAPALGAPTAATSEVIAPPGSGLTANAQANTAAQGVFPEDPLIAFSTADGSVVPNDTNANYDVFVACIPGGTLTSCPLAFDRVSLDSSGGQIAGGSWHDPSSFNDDRSPMSGGGRFALFVSGDVNVVSPATPTGLNQVYLRDTCRGATGCTPSTTIVSANAQGAAGNSGSSNSPAISANGRILAFTSTTQNLINGIFRGQIYGRDACFGITAGCTPGLFLISADNTGAMGTGFSSTDHAAISDDGRFVAFESDSSNFVNPANSGPLGLVHIFERDTCLGAAGCTPKTTVISVNPAGAPGNSFSQYPSISGDGRFIVFFSQSSDLVPGGNTGSTNPDVFLRDTCGGSSGPVAGCTPSTKRISQALNGTIANGYSVTSLSGRSISSDGRYIAFSSNSTNLLSTASTAGQVYALDTCFGAPTGCTPTLNKVSTDVNGVELGSSNLIGQFVMSADGHLVAFGALVGTAPNQVEQIFLANTGF